MKFFILLFSMITLTNCSTIIGIGRGLLTVDQLGQRMTALEVAMNGLTNSMTLAQNQNAYIMEHTGRNQDNVRRLTLLEKETFKIEKQLDRMEQKFAILTSKVEKRNIRRKKEVTSFSFGHPIRVHVAPERKGIFNGRF